MKRKASDGRVLRVGEYERTGQRGFMYKWRDAYGKQMSISDVTLEGLREKERQVKIDQLEGRVASKQRLTVNDYYNLWQRQKKRTKIKRNVLSNYMYMYTKFVSKSFIGKMQIKDVKKSDIQELYGQLLDEGLAVSTIDNLNTCVRQVFTVAFDDDAIRRNPCDGVIAELRKNAPASSPRALTIEEQQRFLQVIAGTVWEPVFTVMLLTGMRVAEVCALCWDDIDDSFLYVRKNFIYYRDNIKDKAKGDLLMERKIQSTKNTTSNRRLPLNDVLRHAFDLQRSMPLNDDVVPSDDGLVSGFVFANRNHQCYNQNSLNRALKRIVADANADENATPLPSMHCHLLRKTYCSNLCRVGVDLATASKLMGHKDTRVTLEIYTDVQSDMLTSADTKLIEWFSEIVVHNQSATNAVSEPQRCY